MKKYADLLIVSSAITIILAIIGAFVTDLWLASTQWILIAGVLAIWAVYLRVRE